MIKEKTEAQKLKMLDTFAKNAKIQMALNSSKRNWTFLYSFFGQGECPPELKAQPIENLNTSVDTFVETLKRKVTDAQSNQITGTVDGRSNTKRESTDSAKSANSNDQQINLKPSNIENGPTEESKGTTKILRSDSIFIAKFPDQEATLTTQQSHGCDQLTIAQAIFDDIWYNGFTGQQIVAPAGSGKTYVMGAVIKNLVEHGFAGECLSPWPFLYVTKASVVAQTESVFRDKFGIDTINTVQVINIEQLRAKLLGILIEEIMTIEDGEEVFSYKWRRGYRPRAIFYDENQYLARDESIQSRIANALHDDEGMWETIEVGISATPWSRVCEAKHFAVSTKKELDVAGIGKVQITNDNWPLVAKTIAAPSDPTEHCTAAIKRFTDIFDTHIKRIKNIRPRHKSFNSVTPIIFADEQEAEEYTKAVERHNKRKGRIEADESLTAGQRNMALLAEYTIFRKAAENCRRRYLASWANDIWNEGYAPAIAFAFKQTGSSVIRILIETYGWDRDDISIIWGGATEALNAKKKLARRLKDKNSKIHDLLDELGLDAEEDLGIDLEDEIEKASDQLEFEKKYDLLVQKPKDRERERLKFQRQRSKLCMYSYKSGGVGLSLHHEAEYPHARPRRGKLTPVYSEKELVQGVGRLPRLTSISDTYQDMCYYKGTIEEEVALRVKQKLRCLKEVVRGYDSWEDLITGGPKVTSTQQKYDKVMDAVDEVEDYGILMEVKD